ncbi:MAG: methyltransferase domain-containing protein [Patescibacteria group bacterium]
MEYVSCPLCGKNDSEAIFSKGNLAKEVINVICKNCGLVYVNPRLSKEEYDSFHRKEFLSEKNLDDTCQVSAKRQAKDFDIKKSIYNFLEDKILSGQNILDIGCGFGTLLDIFKKNKNINAYGIELGDLDVKFSREKYGLDVFQISLEEFAAKEENYGKFDVIILHHTLEHLPEPLASLSQIKKLLKPQGILYIGVPNILNIKKRPDIFFQVGHPLSFSPHSLKSLLEKAGFGVVKYNKNAGYPGGMEVLAKPGEKSAEILELAEGSDFKKVADYVKSTDEKFNKLRKLRDRILFFVPASLRIKLGRIFYKIFKNKSGLSDKRFFALAVIPMSFLAGFLFVLRHLLVFIKVQSNGGLYTFFSFANPDPLFYYAPFLRSIFDGSLNIVDGRILENFYLPNLWSQIAPILMSPFIFITRSISWAFISGHFFVAAGSFVLFYLLCRQIIKKRVFSLLYSLVFTSASLIFNYFFPVSLENLRLVGRAILPFGSPPGEVLLSKYVSFSLFPGLIFFVSAFYLSFLALKSKKIIFTVLAGLNIGLLIYIVLTHAIYICAALFVALIAFMVLKDYENAKKIIYIYLIAFSTSVLYWFNFLQIKMLPYNDEFYKRLGGEITHEFRWSYWPEYIAYIVMAVLIFYWGKKYNKRLESVFVASGVLAAILVLNMQVIAGFNPAPTVWAFHQLFLGFALGWLIIFRWIYDYLASKINKKLIAAAFLVIFIMLIGKMVYTEIYASRILLSNASIPRNINDSLAWLNKNTEKDSVVASPSLVTNALLPAFTHNNSLLPAGVTSPLSQKDIIDRYLLAFKLFGVSLDHIEKAMEGGYPIYDDFSLKGENLLFTCIFESYYSDNSLDGYIQNKQRAGFSKKDVIRDLTDEYKKYPERKDYLLNKYQVDYLYFGPYERNISDVDLSPFELIYDKGGIKIFKVPGA